MLQHRCNMGGLLKVAMTKSHAFPTAIHELAAESIIGFFSDRPQTLAVMLVNSCARGVAIPASDLDMAILVEPSLSEADQLLLETQWRDYYAQQPIFGQLKKSGEFSGVHLDLYKGLWTADEWDEGGGPDNFEIEIGNLVAYAVPLWERTGAAFVELQTRWLPYYNETLRQARLKMVNQSIRHNIARLEFYVGRGLYFQGFDRLYHAFQEFLQAVFIARRVYPIAYNKWIHEQVVDWLKLPALYAELPHILEIGQFEGRDLIVKGQALLRLQEAWTSSDSLPEQTSIN
jgi:predicted nucleotidyltransferase